MSKGIHKIHEIDNLQKLQTLLEACYCNDSTKENLFGTQGALKDSEEIIKKNEFNLDDEKSNYLLKIQYLNLSCSDLTGIPIEVCQLKYLTVLNLNNNQLDSLPEDLGNLYNLVTLQLSGNKLNCLPKSLRYIQQLNCLDISHNDFYEVPDVLYYGLRVLKVLDLSHNKISVFNDPPVCINVLVILIISNNVLMQLPTWIFENSCHLQILDVGKNQMCFHNEFVNLCGTGIFQSLRLLNLENCNYSSANIQVLCDFKKLEVLNLGNKTCPSTIRTGKNYFGNFTMKVFENLICVKYLYLQNVQIATLPIDFNILKNIKVLDLSNNLISWLPECFCNLISLRILYLTSNQLYFLPKNIGCLVNLQQIHLGNNKLGQIPESFYNLTSLEFVDFYNNRIEKIDEKIFMGKDLKGIDLELNYVDFSAFKDDGSIDNIINLYESFKNSFRKAFGLVDCRNDLQNTNFHKTSVSLNCDSQVFGSTCSISSNNSEQSSEVEDPPTYSVTFETDSGSSDWEKNLSEVEEDQLFDPNENMSRPSRNSWSSEFQKNYCPAKYHVSSLKKTFVKNYKLALQKETVEGQFDSD